MPILPTTSLSDGDTGMAANRMNSCWTTNYVVRTHRVFEVGANGVEPLQVAHHAAREASKSGAAEDGFAASLETHPFQEAVAALEHYLRSRERTH